jgi:hypothetical protein
MAAVSTSETSVTFMKLRGTIAQQTVTFMLAAARI